jgi:hypothetical protein
MNQVTIKRIGQAIGISLCFYWMGLFILTHLPYVGSIGKGWKVPFSIPIDKLAHFTAYTGLGFLATAWWSWGRMPPRRELFMIAVVILIYAALEEITQIPFNRHADLSDWIADLLGVSFGIALCRLTWHLGPRWLSGQNIVTKSSLNV